MDIVIARFGIIPLENEVDLRQCVARSSTARIPDITEGIAASPCRVSNTIALSEKCQRIRLFRQKRS